MKMGTQELHELQMMMEEDDFESLEPANHREKIVRTRKHLNPESKTAKQALYKGNYEEC